MLHYAGVPVTLATREQMDWIARNISLETSGSPLWRGRVLHPRVGSLLWPVGASRWAEAWVLADEDQLALIQQVTGTAALTAAYLEIGLAAEVKALMYMLPPRPLTGLPGARRLWLIPLVDDRYFWGRDLTDPDAEPTDPTLAEWLEHVIGLLPATVTATVPDLPDAYEASDVPCRLGGLPSRLPGLIDQAAGHTGVRCLVPLDWSQLPVTFPGATAAWDAATQQTALKDIRAGGLARDPELLLPSSYEVLFRKEETGLDRAAGHREEVSYLGGSEAHQQDLYSAAVAVYGLAGITNGTSIAALAQQLVEDWAAWQRVGRDIHFPTVLAIVPDATGDIEWHVSADGCYTRVTSISIPGLDPTGGSGWVGGGDPRPGGPGGPGDPGGPGGGGPGGVPGPPGPPGRCSECTDPSGPPCYGEVFRYACTMDNSDPPVSRLAEYSGRVLMRDGCVQGTQWSRVGFLPICCDCALPASSPPPACDPEDGVDTDCCLGVPCELCLTLFFSEEGCGEVQIDLVYDEDGYDNGDGTTSPMWSTVTPVTIGECAAVTVELVCHKITPDFPDPVWSLRIVLGADEYIVPAFTWDCEDLLLVGGLNLLENECCPLDTTVDFVIQAGPCDDPAPGNVTVECCENPVPSTLYATFSNGTNDCTCMDGITVTLEWDGTGWTGSAAGCSLTIGVNLACVTNNFTLAITGCAGPSTVIGTLVSCDPLLVTWTATGFTNCCTGNADITITETPP